MVKHVVKILSCNKSLEHVTNHYIIFIVIGQSACFAHQNPQFLVGKTSELTNHDKDDVIVCQVF